VLKGWKNGVVGDILKEPVNGRAGLYNYAMHNILLQAACHARDSNWPGVGEMPHKPRLAFIKQ
jgi:hypothetical protein